MNVFLVILVTIALTFLLFYGAFYNIKDQQVKSAVREILSNLQKKGLCVGEEAQKCYEEIYNQLRHAYGLDKPWYEFMWTVIGDVIRFDFGNAEFLRAESGSSQVSVIIAERVPRTVLLLGTSVLLTTIIGLVLGLYSANKPQSLLDKFVIVSGLTGYAFASWWVGIALQFFFAYQLKWLPAQGIIDYINPPKNAFEYVIDVLRHMVLPVTALTLVSFGGWALIVRNLLIGTFAEDFVVFARAKGVPERKILFGHALKSAAPPIITIIALSIAGIFGGAIITETIFNWNGLGVMIWQAINVLDMPVIIAFFYISTILIVLANFIADILYGFFDPRVKT